MGIDDDKSIYKNIIDVFVQLMSSFELLPVVEMFLHVCLESLFFLIRKLY